MFRPLGKRVLCRPILTDDTFLPGGKIVMLDDTRDILTEQQAEVVVANPSADPRLTEGTWILHRPMCRVAAHEDHLFWLLEDDIVAILG